MDKNCRFFTNSQLFGLSTFLLPILYIKNYEASHNFRLGFALSNRSHLHRAYVVTVCNQIWIAVFLYLPFLSCLNNITYSKMYISEFEVIIISMSRRVSEHLHFSVVISPRAIFGLQKYVHIILIHSRVQFDCGFFYICFETEK